MHNQVHEATQERYGPFEASLSQGERGGELRLEREGSRAETNQASEGETEFAALERL